MPSDPPEDWDIEYRLTENGEYTAIVRRPPWQTQEPNTNTSDTG